MRKLSMKGKRGKSEEPGSDGESEENGVGVTSQTDENASSDQEAITQKKKKKGRKSTVESDKTDESVPLESETNEEENGSPAKKRKKDTEQKPSTSEDKSSEEEYEVQKVVGQRIMKGRRQFLVRWKGYDADADTWEQEKNLKCPQLIEEYLAEQMETSGNEKTAKNPKTPKTPRTPRTPKERKEYPAKTPEKTPKSNKKKALSVPKVEVKEDENNENDAEDDTKEFEVERIREVRFHQKTKTRDFLIRWKGFSAAEDSWEPEKNLNCPELISRFMEKVEEGKKTDLKELRTNPVHTKRYTLMSTDSGRRLSRRNVNKQRATYHECDE